MPNADPLDVCLTASMIVSFFESLASLFPNDLKGRLMAKYVPFLAPIRLLVNLHKGQQLPLDVSVSYTTLYLISCQKHLELSFRFFVLFRYFSFHATPCTLAR